MVDVWLVDGSCWLYIVHDCGDCVVDVGPSWLMHGYCMVNEQEMSGEYTAHRLLAIVIVLSWRLEMVNDEKNNDWWRFIIHNDYIIIHHYIYIYVLSPLFNHGGWVTIIADYHDGL